MKIEHIYTTKKHSYSKHTHLRYRNIKTLCIDKPKNEIVLLENDFKEKHNNNTIPTYKQNKK